MQTASVDQAANQALGCFQRGEFAQAQALCQQILSRQAHPLALLLMGIMSRQSGQLGAALEFLQRAAAVDASNAGIHQELGRTLEALGQLDSAIAAYRQAIALAPKVAGIYTDLGIALKSAGRIDEAIETYRQALRLDPTLVGARNNLGLALTRIGRFGEAVACLRELLAAQPRFAEGHVNLGQALAQSGQLDEAILAFRQSLSLKPGMPAGWRCLGGALQHAGRMDEAVAAYRKAVELAPDESGPYHDLLYALHFHPGYDAKAIYVEHLRWSERFARPLQHRIRPHANDRSPDRPLRIGYVSPDFSWHVIGRFLRPILECRDRAQFQVYLYSDVTAADANTAALRQCSDVWRPIVGQSDEAVAEQVRADQIDILVDLSMHMAGSRLLVFARKPAPVQATYLAYPGTTGLTSIDYRLTDPYLDPPGGDESCYSESSFRLPETYWCYQAMPKAPAPAEPPAARTGHVTFGCLNNFWKINPLVWRTWAEILASVDRSRLIVHALEGSHRQVVRDALAQSGIGPARIEFVGKQPLDRYYQTYNRIDIALDPFPYVGGTTTCDALWMGVPVVSLAGTMAIGRGGLSILSNIGLPELVATTPDQYKRIAVAQAGDLPRLATLRAGLRQRMQNSPLMDAPRFARNIEAAYRAMWRKWCGG